jgi:hypothetical protein
MCTHAPAATAATAHASPAPPPALLLLLLLLLSAATEDGKVTDGLRTAVCGPLSQHVADTLQANGVTCAVVADWACFHQLMLVKLLWSCIFWLLSAGLGGKTVSGCVSVWCGVGWCGVVWCGVVWCGVVWCGVVWCGVCLWGGGRGGEQQCNDVRGKGAFIF